MPPSKRRKKKPKDPHLYLTHLIREIHQNQQTIRRLLGHFETRMDRIEWLYREFLKVLDLIYANAPVSLHGAGEYQTSHDGKSDKCRVLQEEARHGVYSLEFKPLVNGATVVRFNGVKWFGLTKRVVQLLQIISAGGPGSGPDGRGAWTTRAEIARKLSTPNRRVTVEYVSGLLHLLRKKIWENGVNDYYIESDRKLGIRLIWFHGNGAHRA